MISGNSEFGVERGGANGSECNMEISIQFEVFALMWDFYMGFGCRVSMPSLSVGFSCWILVRYLSTGLFTKNAIVSNIPSFYVTSFF